MNLQDTRPRPSNMLAISFSCGLAQPDAENPLVVLRTECKLAGHDEVEACNPNVVNMPFD